MTSPAKPAEPEKFVGLYETGPAPVKSALYAALHDAQAKCKAVGKDSFNTHHKYKYASAEAIYTEARAALEGTGLSLIPTSSRLEMREAVLGPPAKWEREQGAVHDPSKKVPALVLVREFGLVHTSGETVGLKIEWPVVLEAGRPLDKAVAGAETSSLAYLYRDLLSMPRVDARDDLNFGRRNDDDEDRAAAEFERHQKQAPKGRSQNAGSFKRPENVPPPAPSSAAPPSAPASVEAAARRLGPAAKDAIAGRPDGVLALDHEDAVMVEIDQKRLLQHPLVKAFIEKFEPALQGRRVPDPTVENWRGLIGALAPELEKTK